MWLFLYNNIVEFLPSIINDYTKNHTEKESKLLADLNRETWKNVMMPRMLSGHLQGRILSATVIVNTQVYAFHPLHE